jgi:sugar phosphate isomerase/epimerase
MKIGLVSWAFRYSIGAPGITPSHPLSHLEMAEAAASLGAEVLQICDNAPLHRLPSADLHALGAQARRLGLDIEVGTSGARAANLAAYLDIADTLEARVLRVVEDMHDWTPSLSDIAGEVARVLPRCRAQGVKIALENHFRMGSRDLVRLIEMIGDEHVGACLDTLNSIARLEGWREVVSSLAPYAVSLHLKDGVTVKHGAVGFVVTGCPLGSGLIDLPWVLQEVRSHGRDPNAVAEAWMEPAQTEAETLRCEREWMAGSLAYMRRLRDD